MEKVRAELAGVIFIVRTLIDNSYGQSARENLDSYCKIYVGLSFGCVQFSHGRSLASV